MATHKQLATQKIINAIDVWKDDLAAVGFDVSRFNLADDPIRGDLTGGDPSQDDGFGNSRGFGNG